MYLITDTFISEEHFVQVPADPSFIAFRCSTDELPHMELQLREWCRQLREEMGARGIKPAP